MFDLQSGALAAAVHSLFAMTGLVVAGETAVLSRRRDRSDVVDSCRAERSGSMAVGVTSLAAVPGLRCRSSREASMRPRRWNLDNGQQLGQYNHGGGTATAVADCIRTGSGGDGERQSHREALEHQRAADRRDAGRRAAEDSGCPGDSTTERGAGSGERREAAVRCGREGSPG